MCVYRSEPICMGNGWLSTVMFFQSCILYVCGYMMYSTVHVCIKYVWNVVEIMTGFWLETNSISISFTGHEISGNMCSSIVSVFVVYLVY